MGGVLLPDRSPETLARHDRSFYPSPVRVVTREQAVRRNAIPLPDHQAIPSRKWFVHVGPCRKCGEDIVRRDDAWCHKAFIEALGGSRWLSQ